MNATAKRRVAALEQHSETVDRPPYFVVDDESQITPEMRAANRKIYIGFEGPEAWDHEPESES